MAKRLEVKDLDVYYGKFLAVSEVNLTIAPRSACRCSPGPQHELRPLPSGHRRPLYSTTQHRGSPARRRRPARR